MELFHLAVDDARVGFILSVVAAIGCAAGLVLLR